VVPDGADGAEAVNRTDPRVAFANFVQVVTDDHAVARSGYEGGGLADDEACGRVGVDGEALSAEQGPLAVLRVVLCLAGLGDLA
jgi:hypothetical protein